MRKFAWSPSASRAAFILAGALHGAPGRQAKPIRIGALYPLSGSLALLGNENLEGARVAVAMINEAGGIGGHPVEFDGSPATPPRPIRRNPKPSASPRSRSSTSSPEPIRAGLAYAASQVVERRGGIYWETGGIADGLTKRGFKNFFRCVPFTASSNGQLAAAVAKDLIPAPKLGKAPSDLTVLVLHEDSVYDDLCRHCRRGEGAKCGRLQGGGAAGLQGVVDRPVAAGVAHSGKQRRHRHRLVLPRPRTRC